MSDRKIYWRCFHCAATFTKAQERWARDHFGDEQGDLPVCQMRLPGEHHLLTAFRKAKRELRRFYADDTDLIRAIYAMRADHASALQREEERGYAKGLADGRQLVCPAPVGREEVCSLPPMQSNAPGQAGTPGEPSAPPTSLSAEAEDYYPSHEALCDLVSLQSEHWALNGGGPGWKGRWDAALRRAEEIVRVEP